MTMIVLGSFQCRGVLILWHMVGQEPAVLAAGAGRVDCFFFFVVVVVVVVVVVFCLFFFFFFLFLCFLWGWGGLFCFVLFYLVYPIFLFLCLISWETAGHILVSAVITQRWWSVATGSVLAKYWLTA